MTILQQISLYGMAAFYAIAGFNHFKNPKFYLSLMPKFFPAPNLLNQLSGIAEIVFAIGLLFTPTRQISSYLIIALLISFYAVHIPHLIHPPKIAEGKYWFLIVRLFLQIVLIYWAWIVGKY